MRVLQCVKPENLVVVDRPEPAAGPGEVLAHAPAKWNPLRRQGHAPTLESTAFAVDMGPLSDPIPTANAVARIRRAGVGCSGLHVHQSRIQLHPGTPRRRRGWHARRTDVQQRTKTQAPHHRGNPRKKPTMPALAVPWPAVPTRQSPADPPIPIIVKDTPRSTG